MQLGDYNSDVIGCRGSKDNKKLRCQETVSLGLELIDEVMDCIIPMGFESITHQKLLLDRSGAVTRVYKRACHSFMFSLSPPLYYLFCSQIGVEAKIQTDILLNMLTIQWC